MNQLRNFSFVPLYGVLLALVLAPPLQAADFSCPQGTQLVNMNSSGEVVNGSLDAVRQAYRSGQSLRVGWQLDWDKDGQTDISHWSEVAFVSEFEDVFFAQLHAIEAQIPEPGQADIGFAANTRQWRGLLSTKGALTGRYSDGEPQTWPVESHWCLASRADNPECTADWRMVYQHDTNGQTLSGDKEKLFRAVRQGRPVRLAWGARGAADPAVSVEHNATPVFVTITDNELFAQLPEHLAQQGYASAETARFGEAAVMWRGLMGTDGSFDAVWVNRATGEEIRRMPQRARIAWFVHGPGPSCDGSVPVELAVPEGVRLDRQQDKSGPN